MLQKLLLALASALLLWLSWPVGGFTPLIFTAFVPLLFLEQWLSLNNPSRPKLKLFAYTFLTVGLWYFITIYWLKNASWAGVIAAVLLNGTLIGLVMLLFRYIKQKLGRQRGYIALPFLWISAEALHNYWDFSFPWLTLGNVFSERVQWIQWYEHTGVYGGSLWVWAVNLTLFAALNHYWKHREIKSLARHIALWVMPVLIVPLLISVYRYHTYQPRGTSVNIAVIQPNIDTYVGKFRMSETQQVQKFMDLARPLLHDSLDFLIGPETMLPKGMYEQNLEGSPSIKPFRYLVKKYPQLSIVVGASTRMYYPDGPETPTARPFNKGKAYYDVYNTALLIRNKQPIELYHKSKLVAGVEMMPYEKVLKPFLGKVVDDFGGISGTLGTQEKRTVFASAQNKVKVAPVICWEAEFGQYVGGYIQKGAQLIFIITNDDWWGNTQGHRQHLHIARLRAIEHRRSIARSANTGISAFINQRGDVLKPQPYKQDAAISHTILANDALTYYSKAGDVIVRVSVFIGLFLWLFALVRSYLLKHNSKA